MRPLGAIAWTEEAATRWSLYSKGRTSAAMLIARGLGEKDGEIVCLTYFCDMYLISAG